MPDILIRNVPQETVQALKRRAAQHRRSLQQELLSILEASTEDLLAKNPAQVAAAIRFRLLQSGRTFNDSTSMVREDRER